MNWLYGISSGGSYARSEIVETRRRTLPRPFGRGEGRGEGQNRDSEFCAPVLLKHSTVMEAIVFATPFPLTLNPSPLPKGRGKHYSPRSLVSWLY